MALWALSLSECLLVTTATSAIWRARKTGGGALERGGAGGVDLVSIAGPGHPKQDCCGRCAGSIAGFVWRMLARIVAWELEDSTSRAAEEGTEKGGAGYFRHGKVISAGLAVGGISGKTYPELSVLTATCLEGVDGKLVDSTDWAAPCRNPFIFIDPRRDNDEVEW
jgi:hypothetical protein